MAIEYNREGASGRIKGIVARHFPSTYLRLREGKDTILDWVKYPKVSTKSVRDIKYKIRVGSRREDDVVNGSFFEADLIATMLDVIRPGI